MALIRMKEEVEKPKLTEALAAETLARHFDWFRNYIFTNIYFGLSEMDVAVVTPSLRLWEIEIKLTRSDWLADEKKQKWNHHNRRFISRFYYAVPKDLLGGIPEFVPPWAGILGLKYNNHVGRYIVFVEREAQLQGEKIKQEDLDSFLNKQYFKYWRKRFRDDEMSIEFGDKQ